MPTKPIVLWLWLDHRAEPAAEFYTCTFAAGRVTPVSRYSESFDTPRRPSRAEAS